MAIGGEFGMKVLEVGTDNDHVHFLVQKMPGYNVTKNGENNRKYNSQRGVF
ncbi:MAG: transposase [Cytophagales bacterium]|nr:transposase [Cytophagales bacterium]